MTDVAGAEAISPAKAVQFDSPVNGQDIVNTQQYAADADRHEELDSFECLPPFMAEVPEALEGMQLSQRFASAAHQLQEDMDGLKLSLKSLDIGGLQALPDASSALKQASILSMGFQTNQDQQAALADSEIQNDFAAADLVNIGGPHTSDLSAFLSGLRSKYGLNNRSAAQVIEDVLNSDQTGMSQESTPQPYALALSSPDRQAMQQSLMIDNQLLHPAESPAIVSQGMPHDQSADNQLQVDWPAVNQRLRDNGFAALDSVLTQYDRRACLVQELLAATDLARERESREDAVLSRLRKERDDAVQAAATLSDQASKKAEDANRRHSKSSTTVKQLESDVAKLISQVSALEHANRLKEQQLKETANVAASLDKGREIAEHATESARQAKQKMESELARMQKLVADLEHSKRTKEAEVAALAETASHSSRGQEEAQRSAAKAQAGAQHLEADIQRLQRHITHLENSNRLKEQELQQVQRSWSASSQQEGSSSGEAERSRLQVKALEGQLRDLHSRLTRLQADTRIKEAENSQLASGMQLTQADRAADQEAAQRIQSKLEGEVQRLQDQLKELEHSSRERERAVEHWMESASVSSREVDVAEREAQKAKEGASRLEAEVKRLSSHLADLNSSYRLREAEVQKCMESASQSDRGFEEAQAKGHQWKEQARAAESEVQRLQSHVAHLQHAARAQEVILEQLKGRLGDKVTKEERVAKRDAEAYARLKRAFLTNKGEGSSRGQAGAVAAAARELRPVEIVGLYEEQKDRMESELAMLRAEVRALADNLKDTENRAGLQVHSRPYGSGPDEALSQQLAQAETAAAEAQRALHVANTTAAEAARGKARQQAQAEHKADVLAEENASLILELDARPTAKQYKSLQRQMDILERRLNDSKTQGLGETAEEGELELGSKVLGNAPLTTRERIRRDRELHRLGLNLVERIPKDVLIDLVQDVCISLEVADPTSLPAAISKVLRVLATLPRLERFVGEVCEAVYRQGQQFVPEAHARQDPASVPDVLLAWVQALSALDQAHRIQQAVLHLLNSRPGQGKPVQVGLGEIVPAVRHLVEYERNSLAAADTIAAAEGVVAAQPDVLLHRIVAQFQHLFDCHRLEGVLPALNQVYVAYTEGMNFKKALADLLGLNTDASIGSCLQRIRQLLDRHGQALDLKNDYLGSPAKAGKENVAPHATEDKAGGNWPEVEIRVASKHSGVMAADYAANKAAAKSRNDSGLHDNLADPEAYKHVAVTKQLATLLGVVKAEQVVPQAEKIVARLKRLDEVMPKYQHVAGQLYDLLRVKGLDDVVPAVTRLVTSTT
ncbi:hypothetical protein WJX79_004955 [Trebouxia sp. C0005]